jgi:hypothetical protein
MRLILAFLTGLVIFMVACGPKTTALVHDGRGVVVDCATDNAKQLTKQFAPTVEQLILLARGQDGKVDTGTLKSSVASFGADTGWCVLENTVARILSRVGSAGAPMSSPEEIAGLQGTLAELRAELHPGVTYKASP